jgi:hypothetical protein
MVESYYKRKVTFPEDSHDALAGITGALSQIFEGVLFCGLPELFFDTVLLWQWIRSPKEKKILLSTCPGNLLWL